MPASIPHDSGFRIAHTVAGTALTVGTFRKVGVLIGRAETAGAVGDTVTLVIGGRVDSCPTDTGTAWSQGEAVYWDDTNKRFTKTTTSNTKCGYAAADKTSGATTASIILAQQG